MTKKEKAIIMAYTGVCMLNGGEFQHFHKYVEELMGRPVFTHELADEKRSAEYDPSQTHIEEDEE